MMGSTKLLVVDDEKDLLELLVKRLTRKGYEVHSAKSAENALPLLKKFYFDIAIFDIRLPEMDGITLLKETKQIQPDIEIIVLTGHGTIETAIEAMKQGAFDYVTKPYNLKELEIIIEKAGDNKRLIEKNDSMRKIIRQQNEFQIVGESSTIQNVIQLTERIADSMVPVLIEGESGTGKELFAKALHFWSSRCDEPFVAVNSGALPEQLLESELFGHIRGAFTGANQDKKGLVEAADGGTLFLDELAEMPLVLQVKLLRFLESGEFRRVGDVRERKVNVRVVTATNANMEKEVVAGNIREDLFYRLNVMRLVIPPLRERKEDIPLLIDFFLENKNCEKRLSQAAMNELKQYSFPGNVRELHHLIERGILLARTNIIEPVDLFIGNHERKKSEREEVLLSLEDVEKAHIETILFETSWNKTKAAEQLGISVRNLYRKIEQFNLMKS
ncbi:sigma-54-dependent transcriptional regulator [Robertmurraya massiliosenegalensis]|uniref:sigma-54-dependent transcriptional regulator n=2 Tax=Robertmurraya massiliosenegalensis TaxID=1287657 RepID=UPI00054DD76A|nr:sigma-54 dependent transcriptional regulator [Robertmurraya massiliosenegalensis]